MKAASSSGGGKSSDSGGGNGDGGGGGGGGAGHWLRRVGASTAPGVAWTLVGLPFDVIRVRLQTTSRRQFRGPLDCLRKTVRGEGVRALWKGIVPHMLISLPYSTLLFGTYTALRPANPLPPAPTWQERRRFFGGVFGAGCAAGVALTLFQNPLDVWRTRVQTVITPLPPPRRAAMRTVGERRILGGGGHGRGGGSGSGGSGGGSRPPRAAQSVMLSLLLDPAKRPLLLRGISMTAARNIPGNGVYFAVNECLLSLMDARDSQGPSSMQRLLAGGVTGVVFNLSFLPADAIKARLMVSTPEEAGGVREVARAILRDHGVRGFWRGGWVVLAKAGPVNAAGFWTLHHAHRLLLGDPADGGSRR